MSTEMIRQFRHRGTHPKKGAHAHKRQRERDKILNILLGPRRESIMKEYEKGHTHKLERLIRFTQT